MGIAHIVIITIGGVGCVLREQMGNMYVLTCGLNFYDPER